MYKIIYGIPAIIKPKDIEFNSKGHIEDVEVEDDYGCWCDFEVIKDNGIYTVLFETMLGFDEEDGCKKWIKYCFDCMTDYMKTHEYTTERELDLHQVFTQGINVNTEFDSLTDLYAFLKFTVKGFNGRGLH